MVISIPNDAELYAQMMALDCTGKSIVQLIKQMQRYYTTEPFHEDSLEIQISPGLLSDGYRSNASMLARNGNVGVYSYARGLYRGCMVVILYTNNSEEGVGFMRRLRDFLDGEGADGIATLQIDIEDVPESYRYKPELLRYRLKQQGYKLITRKTKTSWIYRRGKNS